MSALHLISLACVSYFFKFQLALYINSLIIQNVGRCENNPPPPI